MRITHVLATLATVGLATSVCLVTPSQAATLQGHDWVATPNGLVGVEQTLIVKASRSGVK